MIGFEYYGLFLTQESKNKRDNKFYPITTCKGFKFEYKE